MRRGEIYLVDFDPTVGAESQKRRPAILVSNDAANRTAERIHRGVVTVVPVTSNTTRVYPFQVVIAAGEGGLDQESKAQAEQVRSVDFTRLSQHIGTLTTATMRKLDDALRLHLSI
jgi:mRNA interferase MazF